MGGIPSHQYGRVWRHHKMCWQNVRVVLYNFDKAFLWVVNWGCDINLNISQIKSDQYLSVVRTNIKIDVYQAKLYNNEQHNKQLIQLYY